jgi:tRNA (guanine37-N1)-methyltransferase
MMAEIAVVTLFPQLVSAVGAYGIPSRAVDKGLLELTTYNPRDYTSDRHRTVDDRPYGGGPGMVMMAAPLDAAITDAVANIKSQQRAMVVYMSPQGERLEHKLVQELTAGPLVLVAGRYEGVDERLLQARIDREISIGDYVLSGGELAAMVVVDTIARQLPGVLGHQDSAAEESFAGTGLLEYPQYTRPEVYEGVRVPPVLTGGNHEQIERWRRRKSLERTWLRRPDLLERAALSAEDRLMLDQIKKADQSVDSPGES